MVVSVGIFFLMILPTLGDPSKLSMSIMLVAATVPLVTWYWFFVENGGENSEEG